MHFTDLPQFPIWSNWNVSRGLELFAVSEVLIFTFKPNILQVKVLRNDYNSHVKHKSLINGHWNQIYHTFDNPIFFRLFYTWYIFLFQDSSHFEHGNGILNAGHNKTIKSHIFKSPADLNFHLEAGFYAGNCDKCLSLKRLANITCDKISWQIFYFKNTAVTEVFFIRKGLVCEHLYAQRTVQK